MRKTVLFILLLLSSIAFAKSGMRIYGYVYSSNREPAPFVTVQVEGTGYGTTTRRDGYYELIFPLTDTATVKFFYIGYEPYIQKVSTHDLNVQKIVYLEEKSILLKEAEVKTFGIQESSQNNLDVDKIKFMPDASGGGIESMLSTYAGVSSSNELSSQYSVRGGNYDENSVYVNNIEVYRPMLISSGQQEGLSFINPDLVSSVSFSAGGYDAKYGDKMASVLDIQYKKPKQFEASVGASLLGGSAYVGQASSDKKFTQIHGIRYKSSNYLLSTLETAGVYEQNFIDYQTYITYAFAPKWEISFLGNFSQNKYLSIPESRSTTFGTYDSPTTLQIYFDGQEDDIFRTFFGAGTIKYQPKKELSLSIIGSAFSTKEIINYDIAGEYWLSETTSNSDGSSSDGETLGVGSYQDYARNELNAVVKTIAHRGEYKTQSNNLEWGISFQEEQIKDQINEFQIRDSAGYFLPYEEGKLNVYYNLYSDYTLDSYRTQGFLQDAYKIRTDKGTIILNGGVRANYWTFNDELLISPRGTIAFIPRWKKEFSFRFSSGLYYQSPFYKEIRDTVTDASGNTVVELNKNIKAQRSIHYVFGSDYYFKSWSRPFKFTTEIYYKHADNVISYNVDNVKIVYSGENDAKAYTAGIDFKLFGEFVPGTDSWISLSLMQSKEDNLNDSLGYVSRPNEQRYNFSMFFQDYFPGYPKYKVHLRFNWADGLPFWSPNASIHSTKNTNRSTPYRRVDLGVTRAYVKGDVHWMDKTGIFKIVKSINTGLEVFNLLDISNIGSYYWVTDIYNRQHAVPNYLTGRQINFRLSFDFN